MWRNTFVPTLVFFILFHFLKTDFNKNRACLLVTSKLFCNTNSILSVFRYKVMMSCWKKFPCDRPSFTTLKSTLDDMLLETCGIEYFNFGFDNTKYYYNMAGTDETTELPSLKCNEEENERSEKDQDISVSADMEFTISPKTETAVTFADIVKCVSVRRESSTESDDKKKPHNKEVVLGVHLNVDNETNDRFSVNGQTEDISRVNGTFVEQDIMKRSEIQNSSCSFSLSKECSENSVTKASKINTDNIPLSVETQKNSFDKVIENNDMNGSFIVTVYESESDSTTGTQIKCNYLGRDVITSDGEYEADDSSLTETSPSSSSLRFSVSSSNDDDEVFRFPNQSSYKKYPQEKHPRFKNSLSHKDVVFQTFSKKQRTSRDSGISSFSESPCDKKVYSFGESFDNKE